MREYLFIDSQRLDLYSDQIADPLLLVKHPEWNVELSLLGPKVSGKQPIQSRQRTDHEKLRLLEDYFHEKGLVSEERPYFHQENQFYIESILASCGVISEGDLALKIWISEDQGEDRNGRGWPNSALLLIEDFRGKDQWPSTNSGCSALHLLVRELDWLADTPLKQAALAIDNEAECEPRRAFSARQTLEKIGAKFTDSRKVSVLYRLRAYGVDLGDGRKNMCHTVIGYPIAIWQ